MLKFILRRLAILIPLFFAITLISFLIVHLAPGKPQSLSGSEMNQRMGPEAKERLEKIYGLDQPILIRYLSWVNRLIRFDFGRSFSDGIAVREKIAQTLPVTLMINGLSLIFILGAGASLGVLSAWQKDSPIDHLISSCCALAFSLPSFCLALALINLFCVKWRLLPVSGLTSIDFEKLSSLQKSGDLIRHLALPVFASSLTGIAVFSKYIRQNIIDVLGKKYILAAFARGLSEKTVLWRHALRNALLPVITLLSLSIPGLIGGSVIIESIFSIPGTGRLFFTAVMTRDYPLVMGMLFLTTLLTLAANLIADLAYAAADPRIRLEGGQ